MYQVNLVKNYLTNSDEIIAIAEKHRDKFSDRSLGKTYNFSTAYGDSKIKSLFHFNMNDELIDAIFKTIPDNKNNTPTLLPPAKRIPPTATDTNVKILFISLWFLIKDLSLIAILKDKHFSLRILIFSKKSFRKV
jgi:hypothetical protein